MLSNLPSTLGLWHELKIYPFPKRGVLGIPLAKVERILHLFLLLLLFLLLHLLLFCLLLVTSICSQERGRATYY